MIERQAVYARLDPEKAHHHDDPDDDAPEVPGQFSAPDVYVDNPQAGFYRPYQLVTTKQAARKLGIPKERLQRKSWREKLGAFRYGGPVLSKCSKLNWLRENIDRYLQAQRKDAQRCNAER